jgi:hypothetical protein
MEKEGLLAMLRSRIDKAIIESLFEIQHVVYYTFSETSGTWEKGGIEGPLVLVKRSQDPLYSMVILNKLHNNSFYNHVTPDTLFEKKHPQLLCIRDKNKNVHGIWSASSEMIDTLFRRLNDMQNKFSQSKMLKNLLDIGGESPIFDEGVRRNEFRTSEDVLRPEFFQKGVVFEEKAVVLAEREKVKEVIVSLASSDYFLEKIEQVLRRRKL